MPTFLWPEEGGWPYPDSGPEITDPDGEVDDDMLSLLAGSTHLFDHLEPMERQVITDRYGLNGHAPCSMKELHHRTGLSRAELRDVLGSGLGKLRAQFGA